MKYNQYEFEAKVWLWQGPAAWHFITVSKDISEHITARFGDRKRGWGSLPVVVTIGSSVWNTSVFPDKKLAAYILPLKSEVRKKEKILKDDKVKAMIEIKV